MSEPNDLKPMILSHLRDGGVVTWAGGVPRVRTNAGTFFPIDFGDVVYLWSIGRLTFARSSVGPDPDEWRCRQPDDLVLVEPAR